MKNDGPLKLSLTPTRNTAITAQTPRTPHGRACPRCHSAVFNVSRRLPDLILSLFISVRRYRCISMKCSWEGTLREKKNQLPEAVGLAPDRPTLQRAFAHPARLRPARAMQETRG